MKRRIALAALVGLLGLVLASTALADTPKNLVTLDKDGKPQPGLATAWKEVGENRLQFTLGADTSAKEVEAALKGNIGDGEVSVVDDKTVLITGMVPGDLFKRLATVIVGGEEDDPFAALSGLGGDALALGDTDSGSSIRARKKADMSEFLARDKKKQFMGKVTKVTRGNFPFVLLEISVARGAKAGPYKALKKKKIVGYPVIAVQGNNVDFTASDTMANLVGWYLKTKDKVTFEIAGETGGKYKLGFIKRK